MSPLAIFSKTIDGAQEKDIQKMFSGLTKYNTKKLGTFTTDFVQNMSICFIGIIIAAIYVSKSITRKVVRCGYNYVPTQNPTKESNYIDS